MPSRLLAAVAVAVLSGVGCGTQEVAPPPTAVDEVALRIDRLHRQMADVATAQREATAELPMVLDAVRELDAFVAGMLDPERHRATEDTWPRVDAAVTATDPAGSREPLVDVAVKVDTARVTLARAREALPEEWERAYLDAEDRVLMAVRTYAQATDALVQILQRHWPTYLDVHARSASFIAANEFYRSSQEAVHAYEVRIGRLLGPLQRAQDEIAAFRDAQADAGAEVNRASAFADEAWEERPPAPTPSSSP